MNVDRVIYLAESGGFEVLMPDADLYSTKLDGNGTNSNGTTLGDPAALTAWLREADKECDYFRHFAGTSFFPAVWSARGTFPTPI